MTTAINWLIRRDQAVNWILNAQRATPDGGVSAYYHLESGYYPKSYPEVTGYIVPTMFDTATLTGETRYKDAAIEMTDWVASVQLKTGANAGAVTSMDFSTPYVFDTGQAMLGWVRSFEETENHLYLGAAIEAGDWLALTQRFDGWLPTTAYSNDTHTYHSRVDWALLRLYQVARMSLYKEVAIRNLEWVLSKQQDNGWFDLGAKDEITHFIAYTGRGLLESGILLGEDRYLRASKRLADVLLELQLDNGMLYGRYDAKWQKTVDWCCVTGDLQIAIIWLRLYSVTNDQDYYRAAKLAIERATNSQNIKSDEVGVRGGIPGSDPINGGYYPYQYLSWATKFYIDAVHLMLNPSYVLTG